MKNEGTEPIEIMTAALIAEIGGGKEQNGDKGVEKYRWRRTICAL